MNTYSVSYFKKTDVFIAKADKKIQKKH